MSVPHQAVLLCAGEGRRLAPFTRARPKPLLPLLNVPLLEHALTRVARAGVRRVALNAFHLAEQIAEWARGVCWPGLELHVEREPVLLGTGGALTNLRGWIDRAPLLLLAGDIVADFDLPGLGARHAEQAALATMALAPHAAVAHYGAVDTDGAGRIVDIAGLRRPPRGQAVRSAVNASAHVLAPEFIDRLPAGPCCLVRQGYLPALEAGATIASFDHEGPWAELGSAELWLAAQRAALEGRLPLEPALLARGGRRLPGGAFAHPTAQVHPTARLDAFTVLGPRSVVGARARLSRCLLLERAVVADDVELQDAIVEAVGARAQP